MNDQNLNNVGMQRRNTQISSTVNGIHCSHIPTYGGQERTWYIHPAGDTMVNHVNGNADRRVQSTYLIGINVIKVQENITK